MNIRIYIIELIVKSTLPKEYMVLRRVKKDIIWATVFTISRFIFEDNYTFHVGYGVHSFPLRALAFSLDI